MHWDHSVDIHIGYKISVCFCGEGAYIIICLEMFVPPTWV